MGQVCCSSSTVSQFEEIDKNDDPQQFEEEDTQNPQQHSTMKGNADCSINQAIHEEDQSFKDSAKQSVKNHVVKSDLNGQEIHSNGGNSNTQAMSSVSPATAASTGCEQAPRGDNNQVTQSRSSHFETRATTTASMSAQNTIPSGKVGGSGQSKEEIEDGSQVGSIKKLAAAGTITIAAAATTTTAHDIKEQSKSDIFTLLDLPGPPPNLREMHSRSSIYSRTNILDDPNQK